MTFITAETSREDLIAAYLDHINDIVDMAIEMNVDPENAETPTESIRGLLVAWIEAGDETAAA